MWVRQWGNGADNWTVGGFENASIGRLGDSHWGNMTVRQWHNGTMGWDTGTMSILQATNGCTGDVALEKAAVDVIDIWLLGLVV